MKRFLFIVLLLGAAAIFFDRQQVTAFLMQSPCDTPISYKIGSIDSQFGLGQSQVLSDIQTATAIWDSAEHKTLFTYSPNARLTVNFVYDQRTALNSQINQLQSQLSEKGKTLDQQVNEYEADAKAFEQKLAAFNATVDQYNSQGGAPPDVYKSLIDEQNQLKVQANALNERARELKLSTRDYNVGVSNLNSDVNQFNSEIALKPEEGLYDGGSDTITLYFASDYNDLIHTLTHEFGHALGMQHVLDTNGIMYPYTTTSLTPSPGDLQELSRVCKKQPLPYLLALSADKWLVVNVRPLIAHYLNLNNAQ